MTLPTSTRLLEILNTRLGRTSIVLVLILIVLGLVGRFFPQKTTAEPQVRAAMSSSVTPAKANAEEPVKVYRRPVADFPEVQTRPNLRDRVGQPVRREAAPTPTPLPPEGLSFSAWKEDKPSPTPVPSAPQPSATPEIRQGQEVQYNGPQEAQVVGVKESRREEDVAWAPFGRLIKCELVNTVDSYCPLTPIIGLVTEDVWFDGKLVVPVGSEIHGKSAPCASTAVGRIGSQGPWVIVLPSTARYRKGGREWTVKGRVLDMSQTAGEETWGITDGSYGMAGMTISTSDKNEVRLFVAQFLSAMSQGLQSTHTNNYTGQIIPDNTVQNSALAGMSGVMKEYSQQVMDAIKRDGSYTRVPAGKQFYLYVEQSLDETDAQRNRSKVAQAQYEADVKELQAQGKTSNPLQALMEQISNHQSRTPENSTLQNNSTSTSR